MFLHFIFTFKITFLLTRFFLKYSFYLYVYTYTQISCTRVHFLHVYSCLCACTLTNETIMYCSSTREFLLQCTHLDQCYPSRVQPTYLKTKFWKKLFEFYQRYIVKLKTMLTQFHPICESFLPLLTFSLKPHL